MRMRRKGNLDARLEACSDVLFRDGLEEKNMKLAARERDFLNFSQIFKNDDPVYLEIGCGKGGFICKKAAAERDKNFLAVEKISNVLIAAAERAKAENLTNVYFLNCAAEVLQKYIPEGKIAGIYLNFSNPLPKEGFKKQRLTHPKFLRIYGELLKDGGKIYQKTDDEGFFEFSLESYAEAGYKVLDVRRDLAADPVAGDIETEHEARFKSAGKKIFYICAQP